MGLHYYSVRVAEECGLNSAALFANIAFWIKKNRANNQHFHDGTYWTYNSMKAFSEQFPYFSQRQIDTALKKLEDKGFIKTGNYNKLPFDRTKWYALTEKGHETSILDGIDEGKLVIDRSETEDSNSPTCEMANSQNCEMGSHENVKAIPDINQIKNSDNNIKKERKKESKKTTSYDSIINKNIQDESVKQEIYEFIKMRKMMKKPMTDRALELLISKLKKLSSSPAEQVELLDNAIEHNWLGVYKPKGNNGYRNNNGYQGNTEVKRDGSDYAEFDY
ncbi:putative DNA replication protein [Lactobacillus phage phiLdb]|uniref:Putative DNA replication protein n=1 Tax=Lactobacillus phage phiLdb TaxID=1399942 RepID=U3PDU2_9CAUD|nr:replication initiation O-like [Lactobacillus phage phiLdb]AGW43716.1 putative DNA replication protein [Lactobacillus phage phiLdb]